MKFSKWMFLCGLLLLALTVLIACGKGDEPAPSSTPGSDSQQTSADGSDNPTGGSGSPSADNGTQTPPAHVHSYDTVSVTEPTCDTKGYTTHTCSCGDHYEDTYVAATGHSWSETGADYFSCSTCTDTLDTSSATSAGLTYQAVFPKESYTVIGYKVTGFTVETDSFPSNLVIPPLHDGKPVIAIGDHAFSVSAYLGLKRLMSVTIPDSVISIEKYAFSNCTNLETVNLPQSIVKMGADPFNQTEYREMNTQNGLFYAGTALVSISWNIDNLVVREGTTVIADEACQTAFTLKQ